MRQVLIRNPASGDQRGSDRALELAHERGYEVRDTAGPGDGYDLAREAARAGADRVVACGGDGTVNEVVWGIDDAGALETVEFGVVPTGTGNGFAEDVGVGGVERSFEVLETGDLRRLDLGMAGDRPFLKTCVAGFPAGVSSRTTAQMKTALGVVAYGLGALPLVVDALQTADADAELLPDLHVRVGPEDDPQWDGRAVLVLVGNSRKFPGIVWRQAPMEDGLLEVVVVKQAAALGDVRRTTGPTHRLETPHLLRLRSPELAVSAAEETLFSVDGEERRSRSLPIRVRPRVLRCRVGEGYAP